METLKAVEIGNFEKLCIFTNWTLKALGIAFLLSCWAVWKGYPTPFRSAEAMHIESELGEIALAMSAAQDDILELHKKVKK